MASDQIEYCGNCEHYEECKALRAKDKLCTCKLGE